MTYKDTPDQHKHDPIVLSVRLMNTCSHGKPSNQCCGYAEWLRVIHQVNRLYADADLPNAFGEPLVCYDWWAGGWCEEYPQFRVILRDDNTTNVQAKDSESAAVLKNAVLAVTGDEVDDNGMTVAHHAPHPAL